MSYENTTLMMVEHHKYCCRCEYRKLREEEEPCNECLAYMERENSSVPVYYKAKKSKKK